MKMLQLDLAKKNGVKVPEKEITQAISRIAKGHQSVKQLEEDLATKEHVKKQLFHQQIKEQLLIQAVNVRPSQAKCIYLRERSIRLGKKQSR